jgi:methionyl-tRNA formyltransferase
LKIVLGGNHKLALNVLTWITDQKEDLKLIISEGLDSTWETNFQKEGKEIAEKFNIPFCVGDINSFSKKIEEIEPDIIILCRCKKRIGNKILSIPKIGCTNIHYGLLPRYGGIAPIHWAIRNGENSIGITLQFMSEEFDEGDIIDQKEFSTQGPTRFIKFDDKKIECQGITSWEAYKKANEIGLELFIKNFPKLKNGTNKKIKQDLTKKLYYKKNSINYEKDSILNLENKTDMEIVNLVKSFTFPPCQLPLRRKNNIMEEIIIES